MWVISSAATAITFSGAQYIQYSNLRLVTKTTALRRLSLIVQCIGCSMILINVLNVFDFFFHREPGPVITGILWALGFTGFMFSRLLLLPIWKRVRDQEAAEIASATAS
jgi:hypothetical protein